MWFWIRHITVAIVLLGFAAWLLTNPNALVTEGKKPGQGKGNFSQAAEGMSNFYAKVRSAIGSNSEKNKKYVVQLPKPKFTLDSVLLERSRTVKPSDSKWVGKVMNRRFRKGETLKETLGNYARQEGFELIWWLKQDYVVKHYFHVDGNFLSTLHRVAKAVDADFSEEVKAYFCPQERALIITDKVTGYVKKYCIAAGDDYIESQSSYRHRFEKEPAKI
ncbi:TcpQ domain-containing protein [Algicola sagamiensis]|uniref:TcpQ domain-containing protein n=1 Tax=Algicola sagamiensis TaxID=163869 RepID=UPI00037E9DC6|nr:TcpQ domain-containing protein [Algicola sagamiensis]